MIDYVCLTVFLRFDMIKFTDINLNAKEIEIMGLFKKKEHR